MSQETGFILSVFVVLPVFVGYVATTSLLHFYRPRYRRASRELASLLEAVEEIKGEVTGYRISRESLWSPAGGEGRRFVFEVTLETEDDSVARRYQDFMFSHRPRAKERAQ